MLRYSNFGIAIALPLWVVLIMTNFPLASLSCRIDAHANRSTRCNFFGSHNYKKQKMWIFQEKSWAKSQKLASKSSFDYVHLKSGTKASLFLNWLFSSKILHTYSVLSSCLIMCHKTKNGNKAVRKLSMIQNLRNWNLKWVKSGKQDFFELTCQRNQVQLILMKFFCNILFY